MAVISKIFLKKVANNFSIVLHLHFHYVTSGNMHLIHLTYLIEVASHGHFKNETVVELIALAQNSVGSSDSSISIQITQSIDHIELQDKQVDEVEYETYAIILSLDSVIMTIPGIRYVYGGMILGEIGDVTRFSSLCKILAFSGLDPAVCLGLTFLNWSLLSNIVFILKPCQKDKYLLSF